MADFFVRDVKRGNRAGMVDGSGSVAVAPTISNGGQDGALWFSAFEREIRAGYRNGGGKIGGGNDPGGHLTGRGVWCTTTQPDHCFPG
jgi:hypothetical protein